LSWCPAAGQLLAKRFSGHQLGNATYLFTNPQSMDAFIAAYTGVSKDDIRRNRANIGEKLGFIGRIVHGNNPRSWAKELIIIQFPSAEFGTDC
jgi:hypothetical protein